MFIGEILVREGYCMIEDVVSALKAQEAGDKRLLGTILLAQGVITNEQLDKALQIQWNASVLRRKY